MQSPEGAPRVTSCGVARSQKSLPNIPQRARSKKAYHESTKGRATLKTYFESTTGRAVQQAYNISPKGRARAKASNNAPEARAARRAWRKTPKGRARGVVQEHRRRAAELAATVEPFTAKELATHIEAMGGQCVYCNGPYEHLDHVYPLSKGGPHALSNLVPSCAKCNLRKGNMLPLQWLLNTNRSTI